ncbi:branched-chain amino acid aminotransferase [Candidatus Galacturonibacter soehngenii]|uniref:Branched-chain-amino-acid aminotransferase n=1 Tax=Candidatus Galacturonatibacter soehngenii TaxID=2307010 RepID=A0A7V7QNR3_9FIRM|nr:branched-chain amino acid aminotransferase [Candidatus Galacturonibacter soehngenii]KAB1440553.1 branched-chain amino acid aminotransferase [Candidatus Galacturonibacter soehngenii]MBA4687809.1 branched-chain amino acid aminotransferase [Candidatus Galacturonibacter soehngenii]
MLDIKFEKTKNPKPIPDENNPLAFGTIFTDHMFIMDYETKKGWHNARVTEYAPLTLDPSAMVFHYGQEMFEGLKAYKAEDGKILLFRPDKNIERANNTNKRICIPQIPKEDFLQAIKAVVAADKGWIPTKPGTSLYIRPFVIATDPYLGVRPSDTYKFIIILSPVGPYYPEGLNPVKIWIEDEYVRAVKGGIGEAKTGGNYVASLASQVKAHDAGYSQVLWLDGVERKYIEEVGAMNIFFKIDGTVVTPMLNGSILPGVTRDSCIALCKNWGLPVEERKISIDEIYEAAQKGTLEEVWGTGTAAVISPVGQLRWKDHIMQINDGGIGELSQKLYDTVTGIQLGKIKDSLNWIEEVE